MPTPKADPGLPGDARSGNLKAKIEVGRRIDGEVGGDGAAVVITVGGHHRALPLVIFGGVRLVDGVTGVDARQHAGAPGRGEDHREEEQEQGGSSPVGSPVGRRKEVRETGGAASKVKRKEVVA